MITILTIAIVAACMAVLSLVSPVQWRRRKREPKQEEYLDRGFKNIYQERLNPPYFPVDEKLKKL